MINFNSYTKGQLQDFLSILEQYNSNITIKEVKKQIEDFIAVPITHKSKKPKNKNLSKCKSIPKRRTCPDCKNTMRYCGVTKIYECKCGYSEVK